MLKAGDKVRTNGSFSFDPAVGPDVGVMAEIVGVGEKLYQVKIIKGQDNNHYEGDWNYYKEELQLINSNNIMSNMIEKIKEAVRPEPQKSLVKAGILNSSLELTSEGRTVLEMILIEKYTEELKEKADIILKEEK